jgi:uncharacterized protein (TIGR02246 family)
MRAFALVLTACLGLAGASGVPTALAQGPDKPLPAASSDSAAAAAAIRAQFDGHVAAHRRGDPAGAAAMYADDVRLIGPDGDESRGRAAMAKFYRDMQDRWTLDEYNYATEEIVASGDLAYQIGLWWFRMHDKTGRAAGGRFQFLAVWRRDAAGEWKMERSLWTPTAPVPATNDAAPK